MTSLWKLSIPAIFELITPKFSLVLANNPDNIAEVAAVLALSYSISIAVEPLALVAIVLDNIDVDLAADF